MKYYILPVILIIFLTHTCFASSVPNAPHITVTGEFAIEAIPDTLTISLSLSKVGMDVKEARNDVERRSSRLIATLKNIGIKTKDISSAPLQITPHYNWNNRTQIYAGTEVTRRISTTLRDLSLYDTLIKSIISAQVARINNTRLTSSKEKLLRDKALRGAIDNGMAKARVMVNHLHATLGDVYSIAQISSGTPFPMARYKTATFTQESAFEPGTIQFKETLQIVFYLVQK